LKFQTDSIKIKLSSQNLHYKLNDPKHKKFIYGNAIKIMKVKKEST